LLLQSEPEVYRGLVLPVRDFPNAGRKKTPAKADVLAPKKPLASSGAPATALARLPVVPGTAAPPASIAINALGFLIQPGVGTFAFAVQPRIHTVAFAIQPGIGTVALVIQPRINAITLAIQFRRQLVITVRGSHIRAAVKLRIDAVAPGIQMLIDSITLGVQPLVDAIALVIKVRLDPVTALVQPVLHDIRVSSGQRRASPQQPGHNHHTRCFSVFVHNAPPAKIPDTVYQDLSSG
jgi:hypothetical protein